MVPVDNGLTPTVQHQDSQSAGPQNMRPVMLVIYTHPVNYVVTGLRGPVGSCT